MSSEDLEMEEDEIRNKWSVLVMEQMIVMPADCKQLYK